MATKTIKLTTDSQPKKQKQSKVNINPLSVNIPNLPFNQVFELKEVITNEIYKSGMPPREFARRYRFGMGFGASMRAIGHYNASCVLISQEISPKFVVDQIGYYSRQNNCYAPVFVVQYIEDLTEKIFGNKVLVMTLPLRSPGKISEWVAKRTKAGFKDTLMTGVNGAKPDCRVPENKGSLAATFGVSGGDILAALLEENGTNRVGSNFVIVRNALPSECINGPYM